MKDNELKLAEVQAPHTLGNTKSSTTSRLGIPSAESMTYSMLYVVESLCTTDTLCLLWSSFDIKSYEVILRWVTVALPSYGASTCPPRSHLRRAYLCFCLHLLRLPQPLPQLLPPPLRSLPLPLPLQSERPLAEPLAPPVLNAPCSRDTLCVNEATSARTPRGTGGRRGA